MTDESSVEREFSVAYSDGEADEEPPESEVYSDDEDEEDEED